MARLIAVMGESGSGKTTSLRTLDPESTYIIDCDKKGLSWRGWKRHYDKSKNLYVTDDQNMVLACLKNIDANKPEIKVAVVDTINGIMVADEFRRRKEKGYDKWADLAWAVYGIIDAALTMRDDLTVVFMSHAEVENDDSGNQSTRIQTSGKKLSKIKLESKFTSVLLAKQYEDRYVFLTNSANSTSKSPMGALDKEMPNDMKLVIDTLDAYELGEEDE